MNRSSYKLKKLATGFIALFAAASVISTCSLMAAGPNTASKELKVFFIDVEGGQSTLFVTPAGQSLLIDTGWPGNNGRDADRIVSAAKKAGLSRIDYVAITHFHTDHVGGVPQLVDRIPVGTFIDHGPNTEFDKGATELGYAAYQALLATGKFKHIVAHAGESLPIKGIGTTVISSDGNLLSTPLPGAGQPNPYCKVSEVRPTDHTENSHSLGTEITFGKLKILDLGDLTWDKEMQLMCPNDRLGPIDILVVSHHGWYQSSSPALVEAIHPRVAVMDNGADKGGSLPTFQTIEKSPGLETLWQLHFSNEAGTAHNSAAEYIANPQGPDLGAYLEMTAHPDGSFDIFNSRTNATKHYPAAP